MSPALPTSAVTRPAPNSLRMPTSRPGRESAATLAGRSARSAFWQRRLQCVDDELALISMCCDGSSGTASIIERI
jgi:hypothetical protein